MIFYAEDICGNLCTLSPEESAHCIKVLRHRTGDRIDVIDGQGTFYSCTLTDDSVKGAVARIDNVIPDWGAHPYILRMAVCPTKNPDRYEWFAEKGTEFGLDEIIPIIGERSERKTLKTDRLEKILLSASKQSLKGSIPPIRECVSVKDFVDSVSESAALKLICYCFEDDAVNRLSIKEVLGKEFSSYAGTFDSAYCDDCPGKMNGTASQTGLKPEIIVMIGPEGDFSREEASYALKNGFIPVHLGPSRLRTETAALFAVTAVYNHFVK